MVRLLEELVQKIPGAAWASRRRTCAAGTTQQEKLSHYSNATTDIEYLFPFGWGELWGVADRTDFDLKAHQTASGESMEYFDPGDQRKISSPIASSLSVGVDRIVLAALTDAYDEEVVDEAKKDTRVVLHLHPGPGPLQMRRAAPFQKALPAGHGPLRRPGRPLYVRLRRSRAPLASATAGRMRSARPSASPWILRPSRTAASPCATGIPWTRCACPSPSWPLTSKKRSTYKRLPASGAALPLVLPAPGAGRWSRPN